MRDTFVIRVIIKHMRDQESVYVRAHARKCMGMRRGMHRACLYLCAAHVGSLVCTCMHVGVRVHYRYVYVYSVQCMYVDVRGCAFSLCVQCTVYSVYTWVCVFTMCTVYVREWAWARLTDRFGIKTMRKHAWRWLHARVITVPGVDRMQHLPPVTTVLPTPSFNRAGAWCTMHDAA